MLIFVFLPGHFEDEFSGIGLEDVPMKMSSSFCMCKPSYRVCVLACRISQITCAGVLLCGHCHLFARTAKSLKDVSFYTIQNSLALFQSSRRLNCQKVSESR